MTSQGISSLTNRSEGRERARIQALHDLELLDTTPEAAFDDVVCLAQTVCETPMALVSLVDTKRQWFKARVGLDCAETDRESSFCSRAIEQSDPIFEIADALLDPRFATNPLVLGEPFIRFYAGVPLIAGGHAVGSLCVLDTVPRSLTLSQRTALLALARSVVRAIEYRQAARALARVERQRAKAEREAAIFAAVVAHTQEAMLLVSCTGEGGDSTRITYANAAFARLTGRDLDLVVGSSLRSIATQNGNDLAIARLERAMPSNATQGAATVELLRADGSKLIVEASIAKLPDPSSTSHFVVALHDLTDRVAAEHAAREMHAAATAHAALQQSETRLRNLFSRTPAITYALDNELRFTSSLGGGLRAIGLEPDQVVGMKLDDLFSPIEFEAQKAAHIKALSGESVTFEQAVFGRKYRTFVEPHREAHGRIEGVSGLSFDITDYSMNVEALARTEAGLARVERTAQIGAWMHDMLADELHYSDECYRIFRIDDALAGRDEFYACIIGNDRPRVQTLMRRSYETATSQTFEYGIARGSQMRFVRETVECTVDAEGRLTRIDGILVDVTDRRQAELELLRRSQTDEITGVGNRAALLHRLATARSNSDSLYGSYVTVDIDRFHYINDTFGRDVGNRLLSAVADRLTATFPGAFVARLEKDVFAILAEPDVDADAAAENVLSTYRGTNAIDGYDLAVTLSIGIAEAAAGQVPEHVMQNADTALRAARRAGGDRAVVFDDALAALRRREIALDRDVRRVLERDELVLYYQPIVDTQGRAVAVEALLRWQHPEFGMIPPDEFISIAEENGCIIPIGRWVLRTACAELQRIRSTIEPALKMAVNVSAKQFGDPDLQAVIEEALTSAQLPYDALEIEITESTIARDAGAAITLLTAMRESGLSISVDDFGTGYSGFSSLRRLPIDILKIDRSFVAPTPADEKACAIVDAIFAVSAQLSLHVIAEGVETPEQAAYLQSRGCTMLQGYLYSRPLPATALQDYLQRMRCLRDDSTSQIAVTDAA